LIVPRPSATATPPDRRGETVSTFFAILYAMLSVPVIGVGVLIQAIGLRPAGVVFAGLVAGLALTVAVSLLRGADSAQR
jgi:hypothetical protein